MKTLPRLITLMLIGFCLSAGVAVAQQAGAAGEPRRCISPSRIESLEIISDRRILFEMRDGSYYMNELPYACPSLTRNKTVIYRTSINELCDVDVITVADRMGGGLFPQGSCGLGKFIPMEQGQVEMLLDDMSN